MASLPKEARVFVADHAGLVGSAMLRRLEAEGYTTLLVARRDQRDQAAVMGNQPSERSLATSSSLRGCRRACSCQTPARPRGKQCRGRARRP